MKFNVTHLEKPSYLKLGLYCLLVLVLWFITFAGSYFSAGMSFAGTFQVIDINEVWVNLGVIVLTVVNAFLLSHLLHYHSFIKSRTFLPVLIYLLLTTTWASTHLMYKSHFSLVLFVCGINQLLKMAREDNKSEYAFLGTFLTCLASFIIKELVFLLPVFLVGFLLLNSFNFKTFLAWLIAIVIAYGGYALVIYYFNVPFDYSFLQEVSFDFISTFSSLSVPSLIYIAFLAAFFIVIVITTYSDFGKKTSITRRTLNFIMFLFLFFVFFSFTRPGLNTIFLPFVAFGYSFLFGYSFSEKKTNFYSILFIGFFFVNILLITYNFFK